MSEEFTEAMTEAIIVGLEKENKALKARLDELERVLEGVLPMAKGYAARNKVGRNQEKIFEAEEALK
ncbi:MAG: hypothetical protein O6945_05000 [Gammaproteobacteria bacterium]|nr:hypothetical protein [Gammaproteobacteria bacterium]